MKTLAFLTAVSLIGCASQPRIDHRAHITNSQYIIINVPYTSPMRVNGELDYSIYNR